jgi:NADH dehydrogenase
MPHIGFSKLPVPSVRSTSTDACMEHEVPMNHRPHRITIVGGGAGGLELAARMGRTIGKASGAELTLVDENLSHLWKPLLHEVAAGTLDAGIESLDYLALAGHHGFRFRLGKMIGLDRRRGKVLLDAVTDDSGAEIIPSGSLAYDTLVIAVGSRSNDYGIEGVAEHCLFLDKRRQADLFHQKLLQQFLKMKYGTNSAPEASRALIVAIVGAGATGVELAAELHHIGERLHAFGLDHLAGTTPLRLKLIEAAGRILPAVPERVATVAERELRRRGVEIWTGEPVKSVSTEGILLKNNKFINAHLKVWAAGIKAPEFLKNLDGLEINRLNQLVVHQNLTTTRDGNVFAMGDCAVCPQRGDDAPVPPRSQAAHQQARLLARNLMRRLRGKSGLKFIYRDYGSLIYLSSSVVGNLMGNLFGSLFLEGRLARLIYNYLYRSHQRVVLGPVKTLLIAVTDRIHRRIRPRLKLH